MECRETSRSRESDRFMTHLTNGPKHGSVANGPKWANTCAETTKKKKAHEKKTVAEAHIGELCGLSLDLFAEGFGVAVDPSLGASDELERARELPLLLLLLQPRERELALHRCGRSERERPNVGLEALRPEEHGEEDAGVQGFGRRRSTPVRVVMRARPRVGEHAVRFG